MTLESLFHDLIEEKNSDDKEADNPPIGICRENTKIQNPKWILGGNQLDKVWFFINMIKKKKKKNLYWREDLSRSLNPDFFLALKMICLTCQVHQTGFFMQLFMLAFFYFFISLTSEKKGHEILVKSLCCLPQKHTCLGTFNNYTDIEWIIKCCVRHPAGYLGSWSKIWRDGYVRGQGKCPVTMLSMAAQRALIRKDFGFCFCWREKKPLYLKGKEDQKIMTCSQAIILILIRKQTTESRVLCIF